MDSIWQQNSETLDFPSLQSDIRTDVLIIGGGMAGILCAYMLNQAGVDCVLAEAEKICGGITKNTTAKITSQHGLIYEKLMREFGLEKAKGYYAANEAALERYRTLCRNIDCDFEEKDAFVYSLDDRKKSRRSLPLWKKSGRTQNLPADFRCHFLLPGR